jgi:predicted ATPase
MIKKIRIEDFRCIRQLEMDLEPLTVLVGPNASGKSTVLAALGADDLRPSEDGTPRRSARLCWWHDDENRGYVYARPLTYIPGPGLQPSKDPPGARVYQLELNAMRAPNEVEQAPSLASNGGNLANAFATLPRSEQSAVATDLVRLVDVLADVHVRPLKAGTHRLVFQDRWDPKRWFEPHEVSDGTLLVLALLVLQHQDQRPAIIGLEEPERGLHPYLLGQVIELLRAISEGKHGPATQVVLATQSAELLDHVAPHEVRFLERDAAGGVQVRKAPIDDQAWADAIHEYENSVGQMWLSGSLGGVPGAH